MKFKDNLIDIYYGEHVKESSEPFQNILMMPTISDVNTVEEWRLVVGDILFNVMAMLIGMQLLLIGWPGLF